MLQNQTRLAHPLLFSSLPSFFLPHLIAACFAVSRQTDRQVRLVRVHIRTGWCGCADDLPWELFFSLFPTKSQLGLRFCTLSHCSSRTPALMALFGRCRLLLKCLCKCSWFLSFLSIECILVIRMDHNHTMQYSVFPTCSACLSLSVYVRNGYISSSSSSSRSRSKSSTGKSPT